jgi:hypothetical protein
MGVNSMGRQRGAVVDRTPFGINLGAGVVALVFGTALADALPVHGLGWRFGAIAAVVAIFAAVTVDWAAATALAVIAWLVANGFVQNREGDLAWNPRVDLGLAAMLAVAAVVGLAVGSGWRHVRRVRGQRRAWAQWRVLFGDEEGTRDV